MATATLSNRPSTTFNWADDEEDDFDFESWKATADTSAPTVDELGPLQLPPAEDDPPFTVITPKIANESAPWAPADQPPCIATTPPVQLPSDGDVDEQCAEAQEQLVCRAMNGSSDAPAYPEMSFYDLYSPRPHERTNYTQNWNRMKTDSGVDCRRPVLFRCSPLRQVVFVEEQPDEIALGEEVETKVDEDIEKMLQDQIDENIKAYEQFSEIDLEDLPQLQDGGSELEEEEVQTPPESLWVSTPYSKEYEDSDFASTVTTDISDLFDDNVQKIPQDAPDAQDFEQAAGVVKCPVVSFARHKRHDRHDSMDALTEFRKNAQDKSAIGNAIDDTEETQKDSCIGVDVVKDGPLEAIDYTAAFLSNSPPPSDMDDYEVDNVDDGPLDVVHHIVSPPMTEKTPTTAVAWSSPDLKYTNPDPSLPDYVSEALSTGWFFFTLIPWTTVGVGAVGAVFDSLTRLARRR